MSVSTIKQVAVLGAGVVGLSTAFQVTQQFPSVAVTVIADKFTTETTSHGAAGIFNPASNLTAHPELKSFCRDSFAWYNHVVRLPDAYTAGIHIIDGYEIFEKSDEDPLEHLVFKDFVYSFDEVDPKRLKFLPADQSYDKAYHYTTLMIECRRYLPWLQHRLESLGVTFQKRTVRSLEELADDGFDLIFNCAGLRNFELVDDKALFPVRGHIVRVKAPWIKQFYFVGMETYIIPGADLIVLGGIRQANDWDQSIRKEDADAIMKRCLAICPSLAQAEIDHDWVGLRPHRNIISVENGGVVSGAKTGRRVNVFNNYGHGTNGVGLSMGTAVYAVQNAFREVKRS